MELISRREAKAAGLKRYFTGMPCKHGHVSARRISGSCIECELQEKRAAYAADPAKFKSRSLATYRKDPTKVIARNAAWVKANPGRAAATRSAWESRNRDKLRQRGAAYRSIPANAEKARAAVRDHYRRNAAAYLELSAKRRAAKKRAVPGWFGELDRLAWSEAMRLTRMRRQATGIPWDADHVIALAGFKFCGLHIAENLQVIPAQLNKEKGNKLIFTTPGEWISRL